MTRKCKRYYFAGHQTKQNSIPAHALGKFERKWLKSQKLAFLKASCKLYVRRGCRALLDTATADTGRHRPTLFGVGAKPVGL